MTIDGVFCVKDLKCQEWCFNYDRNVAGGDPGYGTALVANTRIGTGTVLDASYSQAIDVCEGQRVVLSVGQVGDGSKEVQVISSADLPYSWYGHSITLGACAGCGILPTASLTVESNPTNPGIVSCVVEAGTNTLCVSPTEVVLQVKGASLTRNINVINNIIDLADWAGEVVTVCLTVSYDCGTSVEVATDEATVNVPAWVNQILVDPGIATETATTKKTLGAGIAAVANGGRLTITPGIYTLGASPEVSRADFTTRNNIYVTSPGTVVIEAATTSIDTGALRVRASSAKIRFQNIRVQNAKHWGVFVENSDSIVFDNLSIDWVYDTGQLQGINAFYIYQSNNCTMNQLFVQNVATNGNGIYIDGGMASRPTNNVFVGGAVSDSWAGWIIRRAVDTKFVGMSSLNNTYQGVVSIKDGNEGTTFEACQVYLNGGAGIQIENLASGNVVRGCYIWGNNRGPNWANEAGLWFDDNTNCLAEYNKIYDNVTGIRLASGSTTNEKDEFGNPIYDETADIILRFNEVYENTNDNPNKPSRCNALEIYHTKRAHIYHNTFVTNGHPNPWSNSLQTNTNGIQTNQGGSFGDLEEPSDLYFVNNIVSDTQPKSNGSARTLNFHIAGMFARIDGNVYYDDDLTAQPYQIAGVSYNFAGYQTASGDEANSVEANPLLDFNRVPQSGSPAIGNALPLAEITSVAGTTLGLDFPGVFWPGDRIEFEDGATAVVQSVGATSVEVDAMPGAAAPTQGVTLHRCGGLTTIGALQV